MVEQIPGLVVGEDLTSYLNLGYWPSYNVPFFPEIYFKSGYPKLDKIAKNPLGSEYKMAPRAQIFRRDESNVLSLEGIEYILRYNDYVNDPLAEGNPMNAICSRGDLKKENPSAGGCYDTKVSSYQLLYPNSPTSSTSSSSSPSSSSKQEGEDQKAKIKTMSEKKVEERQEEKQDFVHKAYVINGPTSQGLPPFKWTSEWDDSHVDLPYAYTFEFELMKA